MNQWYYAINRDKKGPVTPDQIGALVLQGAIGPDTPVWKDGLPNWVKLETTELSQFLTGPPPLPSDDRGRSHEGYNLNVHLPERFQFDKNVEAGVGLNKANIQAIGHVATKTNVLAIVAFVLALLGFVTGISFIPAIVCGHIALSQYHRDPSIGGAGWARAALIMSYIVLALAALVLLAILAVIVLAAAFGASS